MHLIIFLFLTFSINLSLSKEKVCVRIKGDFPQEKYLRIALKKSAEKALIETGYEINCSDGSIPLFLIIKKVEERPIAFTPKSRISSYSLSIRVKLKFEEREETISGFAPYRQPTGAVGDINRKKAVDEIIDKIYLNMLKFLARR